MINYLVHIHGYFQYKHESNSSVVSVSFFRFLKKICVFLLIFNVKLKLFRRNLLKSNNVNELVVVSLTSYPGRIKTVLLTVFSILLQSILPSKIILYLSSEDFCGLEGDLPTKLLRLKNYGLDIVFVPDNLRSHKKYFYSLQAYPDQLVITVDDDLYYPSDTISRLLSLHQKSPDFVCANVANCIKFQDGDFLPYKTWTKVKQFDSLNRRLYVAIGYGGVLYPPNIRPIELFDIDFIKKNVLYADDLWLKAIQIINNIEVEIGEYFVHPIAIPGTQRSTLMNINTKGEMLNDVQWRKLNEIFNLDLFFINI